MPQMWGERGRMGSTCPDCGGAILPHDVYCAGCGAPLRVPRRVERNAFSTADDFLPLKVPESPPSRPRRALRIASGVAALGLVFALGLGALTMAMDQMDDRPDQVTSAAVGLQRYGAQVTAGSGRVSQAVWTVADEVRVPVSGPAYARAAGQDRHATHMRGQAAAPEILFSRAAGQVRAGTHLVATVAEPALVRHVVDTGAADAASAASRAQKAIAKAPLTRRHPGDGTGGVMVRPSGDGTSGVTLLWSHD